jgi:hypothetical protein
MLTIVVGIVVVLFVVALAKDLIIKTSVEQGVRFVTGLRLNIGSFKAGILNALVDIKNLRLFNPPEYKDKVMLDMPEIRVRYDLPSIIKGKVHLPEVRLDLKEFTVIKNEKGKLNLDSLKVVQAQKEGRRPAEQEKGKIPEIQIDSLELKIGKVIFKDYSAGGAPSVREFNINLNERYSNITDPYSLASLIVVRALTNTTIANLTNFNLQGLQGTVSDTLGTAEKVATEAVAKAGETAERAVQVTGTAAKQTQEMVKKTAEVLKDVFKNPFGSK